MVSLDKRSGRIVWQHQLYEEFGGTRLGFGYSCHPLPYKDTLIVSKTKAGNGEIAAEIAPSMYVTCSHELAPKWGEYERTTAVALTSSYVVVREEIASAGSALLALSRHADAQVIDVLGAVQAAPLHADDVDRRDHS